MLQLVICLSIFYNTQLYPVYSDSLQKINIKPVKLEIIPPSAGIQFYREGIIFLSSTRNTEKMISDHISFGQIRTYYTTINDTVPGKQEVLSANLNFPFPVEGSSFTNDYRTMFFTRFHEKDKATRIYKAELLTSPDGKIDWLLHEEPMSFCQEKSNYSHPALSADGKLMIFASDKQDSYGGMDLYITRFEGNAWSAPVNLGPEINSKSDEMYPGIDITGNLFFSSDRKPGTGGHDIFYASYENGKWTSPVNINTPVNTKYDDIAFTPDRTEGRTAFYTVRKKNNQMQLFKLSPGIKGNLTLAEVLSGVRKADLLALEDKDSKSESPGKKNLSVETKQSENTSADTKPDIKDGSPVNLVKNKTGVTESKSKSVRQPEKQIPGLVVYRVQILSGMKSKGSYQIRVNNKAYDSFEYFHAGAYRTCIGEFPTFRSASEFQNECRRSGYEQAFVAAFKDNVRSTDPSLFKQ